MSTLSLIDRLRRWSYLQDVELWLDPMPGRRRREVLRELRVNLEDAAAASSMAEAIDELGRPRDLARQYVDSEPRQRPSWSFGVLAGGGVLALALLTGLAYMFGMADALMDSGGGTAEGRFLGITIVATADAPYQAWTWHWIGWSWPITIATLLAVLLGAKVWRYWIR